MRNDHLTVLLACVQVTSELEEKTVPPNFTQPIRDAPAVPENGTAHFEARLEPMGDATMTIHWLKDGRPLEASELAAGWHNTAEFRNTTDFRVK